MLYHTLLIITGLLASVILFYRFPRLKRAAVSLPVQRISLIIPARNEEANLSLLLGDLKLQDYPLYEIICVDDGSTDRTAEIIRAAGLTPLTPDLRPADWTGKAWACQTGGGSASGDVLLFLDADVRLEPDAVSSVMQAYEEHQCAISIQPYHRTIKWYEQLSLFFNLIQIAANAISPVIRFRHTGLSGPAICIDRAVYQAIGGHSAAKSSIVDDLALGIRLRAGGYPYQLLMGGERLSYRMYGGGLSDLWHGWSKNVATGASKTPLALLILVFIWITACSAIPVALIQALLAGQSLFLITVGLLYALWLLELLRISRQVGRFKPLALLFFPVTLLFFLTVFAVSLIKRVFHLSVTWKGRKIKLGQ